MDNSRRRFIKNVAAGTSLMTIGGVGYGFSAGSYRRIRGANDRITIGIMGTQGRGRGMAALFEQQKNTEVLYICDVEDGAVERGVKAVREAGGNPRTEKNIFRVLEDKDLDAMFLAPPDHWHVPATILSCVAGKHVYVEKPLGHNPREGEMAVAAARKYKRVVQMGSQRRSGP
jgi:predicted dehydrogenase